MDASAWNEPAAPGIMSAARVGSPVAASIFWLSRSLGASRNLALLAGAVTGMLRGITDAQ